MFTEKWWQSMGSRGVKLIDLKIRPTSPNKIRWLPGAKHSHSVLPPCTGQWPWPNQGRCCEKCPVFPVKKQENDRKSPSWRKWWDHSDDEYSVSVMQWDDMRRLTDVILLPSKHTEANVRYLPSWASCKATPGCGRWRLNPISHWKMLICWILLIPISLVESCSVQERKMSGEQREKLEQQLDL